MIEKKDNEYKRNGKKIINGKEKTIYKKGKKTTNYVKIKGCYITERLYKKKYMKGGNILNEIEKKAVRSGSEPWKTNYILSNQLNPYTLNPKIGGDNSLFDKNPNVRWNKNIADIRDFNKNLIKINGYNVQSLLDGGSNNKKYKGGGLSDREIQLQANEIFRKTPLYYGDTLPYKNNKMLYNKNDMISLSTLDNMKGGQNCRSSKKNKKKKTIKKSTKK